MTDTSRPSETQAPTPDQPASQPEPELLREGAPAAAEVAPEPSSTPAGEGAKPAPDAGVEAGSHSKESFALTDEAAKKLLEEEEERRKQQRKKRKGRLRELEEIRSELAQKELILLEKEVELLERDQTLSVLKEELELERKLRALLTKEKERAEEEAALAMGLCVGGAMLP